jgi:hypothetical protein
MLTTDSRIKRLLEYKKNFPTPSANTEFIIFSLEVFSEYKYPSIYVFSINDNIECHFTDTDYMHKKVIKNRILRKKILGKLSILRNSFIYRDEYFDDEVMGALLHFKGNKLLSAYSYVGYDLFDFHKADAQGKDWSNILLKLKRCGCFKE